MALPDNRLTRPAPSYFHDDVDLWMKHLGQPPPADIPPSIIDEEPSRVPMFSRGRDYYEDDPWVTETEVARPAVTPRHPNVFDAERLERVIKGLR